MANGNKLLILSYEWKRLPLNRWVDELGIQWNSSRWAPVAGSFAQESQYDIIWTDNLKKEENLVANSSTNPLHSSPSGVIWDADLKASNTIISVVALYGAGTVQIRPIGSGFSSIHATYVHKKLSLSSISLGFGSASLTVSGMSSGYDSVSTMLNIS